MGPSSVDIAVHQRCQELVGCLICRLWTACLSARGESERKSNEERGEATYCPAGHSHLTVFNSIPRGTNRRRSDRRHASVTTTQIYVGENAQALLEAMQTYSPVDAMRRRRR